MPSFFTRDQYGFAIMKIATFHFNGRIDTFKGFSYIKLKLRNELYGRTGDLVSI